MNDISAKLQAWRGAMPNGRGAFTQTEAAEFLGVPFRTYQDWEYGKSGPTGLGLNAVLEAIRHQPRASKNVEDYKFIKIGKDN